MASSESVALSPTAQDKNQGGSQVKAHFFELKLVAALERQTPEMMLLLPLWIAYQTC